MRTWMRSSLRRKLSLIMLLTTIIPLLFLGILSYVFSSRITESNAKRAGIDTLRQMEGNLRFMLQDVDNMSIFLIGASDVQQMLNGNEEDVGLRSRVLSIIANLVSSKTYISDITIYPKNSPESLSTSNIYKTELPKLLDIRSVNDKLWTGLYSVTSYAGPTNVISFIRPLRLIGSYQTVGWLSISLDEKVISRSWASVSSGDSLAALLNNKGDVISATDKAWLGRPVDSILTGLKERFNSETAGAFTYGVGDLKKTVLFDREPLAGWTLIQIIPYAQYSAQNRYILLLTVIAIGLAVMTISATALFFIRRVTKPLAALARLIGRVDPEKPLPYYRIDSSDEIGRLADSYNMLGTHISMLKEKLIRNETRKKEADLRALQAQINPHFLYNTLSSIHWISLMTGEKRITDMVGALSDFLRFSLNKGKDYCSVQQELAHIKNYSQVQIIRYPDKFKLEYVVDPSVMEEYMLKLVLQPLVENAMIHGIQKKEGKGTITVYVERAGQEIHFLVHDNGVGMTEERLQLICDQLKLSEEEFEREGSSYGLHNVHERLQLHYGPKYGLTIDSKLHEGTRISFAIPIMEERHENHDRG